ncbi:MAG: TerB family tellurite resistance protein [Polyangiaceae bacterium]|nr:TerB family tellurite resistance protein [Polyangiaceae bacterium]
MATLPKESFLALAAVAWADGTYQKNEGTALLRAAKEHGIEGDALAELESATKQRTSLESVHFESLSEWDKVLTYALAAWIALLDGIVSTEEHASLRALAGRLGLSAAHRERAGAAAFDVSVLPDGRPDKYDFVKLTARLRERMPQFAKSDKAS